MASEEYEVYLTYTILHMRITIATLRDYNRNESVATLIDPSE